MCLLGNKSDCENKVNNDDIREFCTKNNISHFEVSAKTGNNVGIALDDFADRLTSKFEKIESPRPSSKK